jgi:hypothetical protein
MHCEHNMGINIFERARPPPPSEHLGLFLEGKKHQAFSPAAADKTLQGLKLILKLGK